MEQKILGFSRRRIRYNLAVALEAIIANKIKSGLTALGILFGVTSVIAMSAIGRGARYEVLSQIQQIGSNNIIIQPQTIDSPADNTAEGAEEKSSQTVRFSPGLNLSDVLSIREIVPDALVSVEHKFEATVSHSTNFTQTELAGVDESYFKIFNLSFASGSYFNTDHHRKCMPVCIIGSNLQKSLFKTINPLGKQIKCNGHWFEIIGVLQARRASGKDELSGLGIDNPDNNVYIPIRTMLLSYNNPANSISSAKNDKNENHKYSIIRDIHTAQVGKIIVQVKSTEKLKPAAAVIRTILQRRHNNVTDYRVVIPWELLRQKERTKQIFNMVLGLIAGISLLVGGIGIMNIMYASVLERTREIGIRMAIGARVEDITIQFLSEAVMISLSGGLAGIFTGFLFCVLIENIFKIQTIMSVSSVLMAFAVSFATGVIFGIYPARKASSCHPIDSLRYE